MKRSPMPPRTKRLKPTPLRHKKRSAAERERIYGTEAHQKWLRDMPCLGCGRMATEEHPHHLHHTKNGGTGRKADAKWQVPLCFYCHQQLHDNGPETFEFIKADTLAGESLRWWAETFSGLWKPYAELCDRTGLTPLSAIVPSVVADLMGDAE